VFAPFLKYSERGRTILVPPAADVANTFMNKFTGGDPYVTVANLNGILVNGELAGVEYQFDETDRGHLEKMGINPIIDRSGQLMIYGDKTAYQTLNSDLSYLHVRELLNTIQIACKSVLDDYVFTYNIPTTRAEIITRINPILRAMKDSGALVRYEIQCDDVNNDKDVIDNKFCVVDIGVWVSQNMEKIVVPITINRSTTA
jgi:phage tail sheath protein FI